MFARRTSVALVLYVRCTCFVCVLHVLRVVWCLGVAYCGVSCERCVCGVILCVVCVACVLCVV